MPTVPAEPPFDVPALLARERGALMASLHRLDARDWDRRTPCPGWSVKDLVSHLWSTDLHVLSRLRDGHGSSAPDGSDRRAAVVAADEHNARWAAATRGLSPRVLLDRLQESGPQVTTVFRVGDPSAPAEVVPWAGPERQPLWFCGARELTERFVHQQQLRSAVGHPSFDDEEVLAAVVDTVVHAFPAALTGVAAPAGTAVLVEVTGPVRRQWSFALGDAGWRRSSVAVEPVALLRTDAEGLWRLLSGSMTATEQVHRVELRGTPTLFAALRDARAVLV